MVRSVLSSAEAVLRVQMWEIVPASAQSLLAAVVAESQFLRMAQSAGRAAGELVAVLPQLTPLRQALADGLVAQVIMLVLLLDLVEAVQDLELTAQMLVEQVVAQVE